MAVCVLLNCNSIEGYEEGPSLIVVPLTEKFLEEVHELRKVVKDHGLACAVKETGNAFMASQEGIESDVLEDIPDIWEDVADEAGRGATPSWEFSDQEILLLNKEHSKIQTDARTDGPELVVRESSWCVQVTLRDSDSIFTSSAIYFPED